MDPYICGVVCGNVVQGGGAARALRGGDGLRRAQVRLTRAARRAAAVAG